MKTWIISGLVAAALYTNFDFVNWSRYQIEPVHEASRAKHARELLGKDYRRSPAAQVTGLGALHISLFNRVQSELKPRWKGKAQLITRTLIEESRKYQIDPIFVMAIIKTESGFNPLIRGRHGEIGLMQIKPDTAEWIARKHKIDWNGEKTLENPAANIKIGVAYMAYLRTKFDGSANKYVSAYNMGPKNVKRLVAKKIKPVEYSSRVMKHYTAFYASFTPKAQKSFLNLAANH